MLNNKNLKRLESLITNNTLLVILIIALGITLRIYTIDDRSLWFDELHSIIPTEPSGTMLSVIEYSKGDQPPLFFILLHLWYKVFPYDETSGRLFSAIIGVLGIAAMYFLGKEIKGPAFGLLSSLVTSINIFHLYYSQELRFYSLLFLLTTVSFFMFIKLIKVPSVKNQFFFSVISILLLYTHYYGMVVVFSQAIIFIFICLIYKKGISFFLKGLLCSLIVLLAFSPWIPVILNDNKITSFWIQDPGPLFFLGYFERYFNGWWALSFKYVLSGLLWGLLLYYLWTVIQHVKEKGLQDDLIIPIIIFGWSVLTLLIPYVYSVYRIPMMIDRYTIITLPALILMISMGFFCLKNRYLRIIIILIFLVCTFRVHYRYYRKFKKPQFRELAYSIITENTNHYPVVADWAWHFNYFFRKYNAGYEVQLRHTINFNEWLKDKEYFWVIYPEHLNETQSALIDSSFVVEKTLIFHQAQAHLYKMKRQDVLH